MFVFDHPGVGLYKCDLWFNNVLMFAPVRGAVIDSTPSPDVGSLKNLFNGKAGNVRWYNPSGTIEIVLTLWRTFTYQTEFGIVFQLDYHATDFTVEVYNPVTESWVTVATVTGWNKPFWYTSYNAGSQGFNKIRYTFTGYAQTTQFGLHELGIWNPNVRLGYAFLGVDGGDIYGDIDMNGNDIVNPGLVDGVDVSAHAARHWDGGADELSVGKLEGTWGGATQIHSGSCPTAWSDLDLSSYVGARRAFVLIKVKNQGPYAQRYKFRPNGDTDDYTVASDQFQGTACIIASGYSGWIFVTTDANGIVEWATNNGYDSTLWLVGYIALS